MAMPDLSQLIDVFSQQATRYDTTIEYFRPLAADLIRHAGVHHGQKILDIGCGRGAVLFQAAEIVGGSGSVVGIDIAPGMVTAATDEVQRRGMTNVEVYEMDGATPDFPAASFDHVLGSMSVIMIPNLPTVFRNYHTLLRDGGTLAFTSPAIGTDPGEWRIGPFHLGTFLAEALPKPLPGELVTMLGVFDQLEPHRMLGDLRAAGFQEPRAIDVITTVRGKSGEDLVAWTFTHGTRVFWNFVPEQRRKEYALEWARRIDEEFGDAEPTFQTVSRVFMATK